MEIRLRQKTLNAAIMGQAAVLCIVTLVDRQVNTVDLRLPFTEDTLPVPNALFMEQSCVSGYLE